MNKFRFSKETTLTEVGIGSTDYVLKALFLEPVIVGPDDKIVVETTPTNIMVFINQIHIPSATERIQPK
jgi:hypothetical protein